MDAKINIYILSVFLKVQNFLIMETWKNLHLKSMIYKNDVEFMPP